MAGAPTIIISNLGIIGEVVQDVSMLAGVYFIVDSIFKLKKYGEARTQMSQQHSISEPLVMMVVGVCCLYLPTVIQLLMLTFYDETSPLSYGALGPSSGISDLIEVVVVFTRLIGVVGILRGLFLCSRLGGNNVQPGTAGKAITHLIAGVMCVDIVATVKLIFLVFDLADPVLM